MNDAISAPDALKASFRTTSGNACLTCDKFVTDASHRDELKRQLDHTTELIEKRQVKFRARYGEAMGSDNVWLAGRQAETTALAKVLVALDQVGVPDDGLSGARAPPTFPSRRRRPPGSQRERPARAPHPGDQKPNPAGRGPRSRGLQSAA